MKNTFDLDEEYLQKIEEKFNRKKEIAKERNEELFSIFNNELTEEETFALKYFYAYMPLNDLADYNGEFFLKHVRNIFKIKNEVSWGEKVSGSAFLHFVLPYRINNENIENFTEVIFEELYPRVKDLTMHDAVCEINHWCHERATYISTDIRTVAPLTLMRTALGRCGEQSTLLVAALRSLCIPARQCYTPRWAHCDSNHAWVEAWADGEWYFLGACEPEPRLNMGWFSGPAKRAMLVNTRVAGNYRGPEEITIDNEWYTEINLLSNYAACKKITVSVIDEKGAPVEGAIVRFELYNTAEFYPIAKIAADKNGEATLTTGYGDILIHAHYGESFGFSKISVKDSDYFQVVIADKLSEDGILDFSMVPPIESQEQDAEITDEERKNNDLRLKEEDTIRTGFENTFINEKQSEELAIELKLPVDRVWRVLKPAKGNSEEIALFLKEETPKFGEWPLKLLESLREKDLTDTFRPVLMDHLVHSLALKDDYEDEIFIPYIMCPRVNFEMLGAYKELFQGKFSSKEIKDFKANPEFLVSWVRNNIEILEGYNYYVGYSAPKGTFELKKSDLPSRNILFVAMARSFGIPSRLEPSDKRPQYFHNGAWKDANFKLQAEAKENIVMGKVKLKFEEAADIKPKYFENFSIGRLVDGVFLSLDYWDKDISYFEDGIAVVPGNYRLTTGTRLSDGTVLVRFNCFTVKPYEEVEVEVNFIKENNETKVYGVMPSNFTVCAIDGQEQELNKTIKENGAVIAFIDPDREPTKHLLRELKELAAEFNNWGGNIYLVIDEDKLTSSFNADSYGQIPNRTIFCIDKNCSALDRFTEALDNNIPKKYPLVFAIDAEGKVIYQSVGYKLGIASHVIKIIKH